MAGIPDELRRFLLTGMISIPHVEAILQLRQQIPPTWNAQSLGLRIYVPAARARHLLSDLSAIGIVREDADAQGVYAYLPATPELASLLDQLAKAYSEQLIAVTQLIHTAEDRKAQDFADAFRFRKEP